MLSTHQMSGMFGKGAAASTRSSPTEESSAGYACWYVRGSNAGYQFLPGTCVLHTESDDAHDCSGQVYIAIKILERLRDNKRVAFRLPCEDRCPRVNDNMNLVFGGQRRRSIHTVDQNDLLRIGA